MGRLSGKVVLVSGAARGLGAAAASTMALEGAKLVVCDILDEEGEDVAGGIQAQGGEAIFCHVDVAHQADWAAATDEAVRRFGGVDVLVNNAGLHLGKGIEEATLAEWQRLCDVNLTGAILGIKALLPTLRERAQASEHGGAIINMSSTSGLVGSANAPLYSLTKGGITLLTKALAVDFGQRGYRIRVNSVHPGMVDTDMGLQSVVARARRLGTDDLELARAQAVRAYPLGRMATTRDIAQALVYLASDESSFVTGIALPVDGGFTA
ncbi:MAG: hypothetical protein JWQ76_1461 [Ramlibacter sp.]|nr:hypothetical protein [Ramlibacter sp.]